MKYVIGIAVFIGMIAFALLFHHFSYVYHKSHLEDHGYSVVSFDKKWFFPPSLFLRCNGESSVYKFEAIDKTGKVTSGYVCTNVYGFGLKIVD